MCWQESVPSCCWSLWPWWWYFAAIGTTGRPRRPAVVIIIQWCTATASIQFSKVTQTATRTKTPAITWCTAPTKTTCTQVPGRALNPCSPSGWRKTTAMIPSVENSRTTREWYNFIRMLCSNKVIKGAWKLPEMNDQQQHNLHSSLMRIDMEETLQFLLLTTDRITDQDAPLLNFLVGCNWHNELLTLNFIPFSRESRWKNFCPFWWLMRAWLVHIFLLWSASWTLPALQIIRERRDLHTGTRR